MSSMRICLVILTTVALGGCVVYTVADTAVDVVSTTVETTVDVTAGAVDLVIGDDDD